MILHVISVKPEDFFGEIYQFSEGFRPGRRARFTAPALTDDASMPGADLRRLKALYHGLVSLLKQKHIITATDLDHAIERARHEP